MSQTNSKDATDLTVTTLPRAYKIRPDGSIQIPDTFLTQLRWRPGDERYWTVDLMAGTLTLTTSKPAEND